MSKTASLLVLDAHRSPLDILMTAAWVRRIHNPNHLIMPVAGYALYVPLMRSVIKYFQTKYNLELYPVYRQVESHPVNLLMHLLVAFYPSSLSTELRDQANRVYVERSLTDLREGNSVIVVSPYGSPILYGGKIKYGVRKMLELNPHTLITRSRFHPLKFSYLTYSQDYQASSPLLSQFTALN